MTRSLSSITTTLVVVAAAPLVAAAATDGDSQSRTIDRTIACAVRGVGSPDTVRYLDLYGTPRIGGNSPSAMAFTAPGGASAAGARPDANSAGGGFRTGPSEGRSTGLAWLYQSTCVPTRARVSFTSARLRGGQAARFGESHRCDVPARILIRIRAVFRRAVALEPDRRAPHFLSARGRIASAALVITTASRHPIAYASVDAAGRTTIFTSPSRCFPT